MTKTVHFRWENRFVLQQYGAVRKFFTQRSYDFPEINNTIITCYYHMLLSRAIMLSY